MELVALCPVRSYQLDLKHDARPNLNSMIGMSDVTVYWCDHCKAVKAEIDTGEKAFTARPSQRQIGGTPTDCRFCFKAACQLGKIRQPFDRKGVGCKRLYVNYQTNPNERQRTEAGIQETVGGLKLLSERELRG